MTIWADHYANILAHPADDGPRLVAADWLAEFGTTQEQHERAEFIRVGCELANLPSEPPMTCSGQLFSSHREAERHTERCEWCQWTYIRDAKILPLRRRESALLSAVSTVPCQRCKGEKVVTERRPYRVESSGCGVCLASGVVQVSNCVRWAGKLGNAGYVINHPDEWHGRALVRGEGLVVHPIDFRFVRGFIGAVSLSCAALVGETCERCSGDGNCPTCGGSEEVSGAYFADDGMQPCDDCRHGVCPACDGMKRIGGLRSELRQHPLGECVLSDKSSFRGTNWCGWWGTDEDEENTESRMSNLPMLLWSKLEGGEIGPSGELDEPRWRWYDSVAAASAALNAACCRWIRD